MTPVCPECQHLVSAHRRIIDAGGCEAFGCPCQRARITIDEMEGLISPVPTRSPRRSFETFRFLRLLLFFAAAVAWIIAGPWWVAALWVAVFLFEAFVNFRAARA